ncbi:MAG: polysaccharide deacetylase family protein [Armatimonadota bacterium]
MIKITNKRLLVAVLSTAAALGMTFPRTCAAAAGNAPGHTALALPNADTPNELGRIPILMYHSVGDKFTGKAAALSARLGLNISAATFRAQLEAMYKAGWYPVNMRDILSPHLDVPKGKIPFAITFDDARRSQFYYRKDGSVDPNCALGVLLAMHQKYGQGWPNRASFYVVPSGKFNPPPFGQKSLVDKKLRFLVDQGFEVANHSTSHHSMRNMSPRQLEQEMETCFKYVRDRVPEATMDTMALPYGAAPRNRGSWGVLLDGKTVDPASTYHNRCILMAWGGTSYSPWDKRFDTKQVTRIGAEPGTIERCIATLKHGKGSQQPYISDGNSEVVTVPASQRQHLAADKLAGLRLVVINDLPPTSEKKKQSTQAVAKRTH